MTYLTNILKNKTQKFNAFVLVILLNTCTSLIAQPPVPVLVKDISPGSLSSSPNYLTKYAGKLYFGNSNTTGLWITDGTDQGTKQTQLISNIANDFVTGLKVFNKQLFFNTDVNPSWWRTTGNMDDAVELTQNFNYKDGVSYDSQTTGSMFLIFSAQDFSISGSAFNLYCIYDDGSYLDTFGNLISDSNGSYPKGFKKVNSRLIFSAVESDTGRELYSTDATNGTTHLIKDIYPGVGDGISDTDGLEDSVELGNKLCFSAFSDSPSGSKLWCTDGTTAGTVALYDEQGVQNNTFTDYNSPQSLTLFNNFIYFFAYPGNSTRLQLWKASTSSRDSSIPIHPVQITFDSNLTRSYGTPECGGNIKPMVANNLLYFARENNKKGCELWRSDGTAVGTHMLMDINKGDLSSSPVPLAAFNGELYFAAFKKDYGMELWHTNGKAAGTQMVSDLNPGPASSIVNNQMIVFNKTPYYVADDGVHGQELFKITFPVPDLIFSSGFE